MAENKKAGEMDAAAVEAKKEFDEIMAKPKPTAQDLIAFHKKHLQACGHKRLGAFYRDFPLAK